MPEICGLSPAWLSLRLNLPQLNTIHRVKHLFLGSRPIFQVESCPQGHPFRKTASLAARAARRALAASIILATICLASLGFSSK